MSIDNGVKKLLTDEIDMILGLRYDVNLLSYVEYTESVVQSIVCMLVKNDEQELIQSNLGQSYFVASVENNSAELKFLENLRRVNFNVAYNQEDAFQLLMMDRADFLLGVKDTIEFLISKNNLDDEYSIVDSYTTPVEYMIAVKAGNKSLVNLLNTGLSRLKLSGEYEELYFEWVENSEASIARKLNRIINISIIGAITAAAIFILSFIWNRNLKHQVKLKTIELVQANEDLEAQIKETRNNIELKNLICESSPRGIVIFDNNGIISMFNKSALKIAALDKIPIGKCVYDIEPINLMLKDTVNIVFQKGTSYTCEEFRYIKNNNEYIYRYVMYPLYDYDNKLRGIIITIEDITEERKLKEQMVERDKNRVLTQIVAGISHEIRNPLTTIKAFVELIPHKIDNDKFKGDLINVVPQELQRVDKLIGNLIDYSKPKSQNRTTFDLGEVISSSVSFIEHVIEENNISINIDIDIKS
jgi:polar amino acid transport system substrate-binding protein